MIADLNSWKSTFSGLPVTSGREWAVNVANAIGSLVASATLAGIVGVVPQYVFNLLVLQGKLSSLSPQEYYGLSENKMKEKAAENLSNAIKSAAEASQMVVLPGAAYQTATPATTWSTVASVSMDPTSVELAFQKLKSDLLSLSDVDDVSDSGAPKAIRSFFSSVSYVVTGMNSITPTPTTLIAKVSMT